MKKLKQIILTSLSFLCAIKAPAILAEASEGNVSELTIAAAELGVSSEELENLDELIVEAIDQLPPVELGETVSAKVSENLIVESSLTTLPHRALGSFSGTLLFKNVWGGTVITLNAYGEFDFSNGKVSPYRGYGAGHSLSHTINIGRATYYYEGGSSASITMPFSGGIKVGIGDVGIDLNTFNVTSKITCKANRSCTSTWYY